MKVEMVDKQIEINLSTHDNDEYFLMQTFFCEDKYATGQTVLHMPLDRAIELKDKLSKIINERIEELNKDIKEG